MRLVSKIKDLETYVKDINCGNFDKSNIVVEHRSNNPKRDFLFVNKIQCKHIPCNPTKMINMCKSLSNIVNSKLDNEDNLSILVIAFAETATAIGEVVADNLHRCNYIMHTTREEISGSKQLITFEEEHSHATTQKLLTFNDERAVDLNKFNYILFVEDEISTGNTILNFINAFKKVSKNTMKFGVASICNWQDTENKRKFTDANIDRFCLIGGSLIDVHAKMLETNEIGLIHNVVMNKSSDNNGLLLYKPIDEHLIGKKLFKEERLGHKPNRNISNLYKAIDRMLLNSENEIKSVRVVGTEEFMYIPIKVGEYIESLGIDVICHSTTRSKIDIMDETSSAFNDGIKSGICMSSLYEYERNTYVYNTNEKTDLTLVITDATIREGSKEPDKLYNIFSENTNKVALITL